ncbi:replication protein O [Escherichia coli]|uniref:Replication protein O n=1 Tax=Escherichia coli TaxID=562 RepID=A0A376W3F4_ECOLX|nr:replication protein O [Escherichia coli]
MAKAGLLEQNRLSGANRNTLIAGGIMANTAEIFNFPVPDAAQKEPRVADLDDGGNDSNLLIVFYVQIMPDDLVMQLHRF